MSTLQTKLLCLGVQRDELKDHFLEIESNLDLVFEKTASARFSDMNNTQNTVADTGVLQSPKSSIGSSAGNISLETLCNWI